MLAKIPERFVHLGASYMYQSMDLMHDKQSDCDSVVVMEERQKCPFTSGMSRLRKVE